MKGHQDAHVSSARWRKCRRCGVLFQDSSPSSDLCANHRASPPAEPRQQKGGKRRRREAKAARSAERAMQDASRAEWREKVAVAAAKRRAERALAARIDALEE